MIQLVKDIIHFNSPPLEAKKCHKFKEIWILLLSVPQLCKSKFTVTFKEEIVKIRDSDENILITGFLDPMKVLFIVPIDDVSADTKKQRVEKS